MVCSTSTQRALPIQRAWRCSVIYTQMAVGGWWVNFYRPQTKFAKVMFSQVTVCPQDGLCLCLSVQRGLCPAGCLSGGGGGVCPGGSLSRGEVSVRGGLCERGSLSVGGGCHGDSPYSNERVVRILLECILWWSAHRRRWVAGELLLWCTHRWQWLSGEIVLWSLEWISGKDSSLNPLLNDF